MNNNVHIIENTMDEGLKQYPYIGISPQTKNVVMFTKYCFGFRIYSPHTGFKFPEKESSWNEDVFKPFYGTITITIP